MSRRANLCAGPNVLDELVQRSGSNPQKPHYALAQALIAARERDFRLPRGWALCACEPILVDLPEVHEFAVDAAILAKHSGLPSTSKAAAWPELGELAGAVMMSSRRTRLMVKGKLMPDYTHLNTWQPLAVSFTATNILLFSAVKAGAVVAWPAVLNETAPVKTDAELRARSLADLQ